MHPNDERKFLHDLANPLAIAMFAMETFLECRGDPEPSSDEGSLLIKQVSEALEQMRLKLQLRRELLIERGVPSAKGE